MVVRGATIFSNNCEKWLVKSYVPQTLLQASSSHLTNHKSSVSWFPLICFFKGEFVEITFAVIMILTYDNCKERN